MSTPVKLSLTNRKAVKAFQDQLATEMKAVSAAWGSDLTWHDNTDDIVAIISQKSGEDAIAKIADKVIPHVKRFAEFFGELKKENDELESFKTKFTAGKIGLKIVEAHNDDYWLLEDGALFMRVQYEYLGSYLSYFNLSYLQGKLTSTKRPFPVAVVKNLNKNLPEIESAMEQASKSFGRKLTLTDNYNDLIEKLKTKGTRIDNFGDQLVLYPKRLAEVFAEFCKDADNLEALQEAMSKDTVTIRFIDADTYWALTDGVLFIDINIQYFGSYLSYFNAAGIEKLL